MFVFNKSVAHGKCRGKSVAYAVAVAAALLPFATAHAAVAGASSDTDNIVIGTAQSSPNHPGGNYPGIRVAAAAAPYGSFTIGFNSLQSLAGVDATVNGFKISTLNVTDMPPSHSQLGNFDFAQVPGSDVYFGEWTASRSNPKPTHTVYYGGQHKTTNMPSSGTAKYRVLGVKNLGSSIFSPTSGINGVFKGRLTADFSTGKLKGIINKFSDTIHVDANINSGSASFNGTAKYMSAHIIGQTGTARGHFFGSQAKFLAGIAKFDGRRELDTAFGGVKQPKLIDPIIHPFIKVKK